MGSSPLARGLRLQIADHGDGRGIIPARAGFTRPSHSYRGGGSDHPRSRGVYRALTRRPMADAGSSPLARGLPERPSGRLSRGRIIPARAGFTECGPPGGPKPGIIPARAGFTPRHHRNYPTPSDHPRSRGVYTLTCCSSPELTGSSPLARGLLNELVNSIVDIRIIPARAGFTVRFGH